MALVLGFENAGIFSLAISISNAAFAFAIYGVRGYQVSDVTRKYSDRNYIIARIITSSLAIIGCFAYTVFYQYNMYTTLCIYAYLLFKISEAFVDVYHGIIQRGMRMDYIGKSFILRGIICNSLFVGCMFLTKNLLLSIALLAASSYALIFIYDHKVVKIFYEKSNNRSFRRIVGLLVECLPLALYTFLSNVIIAIPRISLETIKGSEVLGIYASIAIPAAVIQVLSGYIFAPMLTIFADHVNQKNFKLFYILLFKTISYIALLSIVLILGGWAFGGFGLTLLFGDKISGYTYLFVPILFISSLTALSWFIGLMLTVLREFTGLIVATTVAIAVCFLGSSAFINSFNINGASYILILALTMQIVIMCVFMFMNLKAYNKA